MSWTTYKIGDSRIELTYHARSADFDIGHVDSEYSVCIRLNHLDALISTLLDFRASFEQEREHEAIEAAKIQGRAELRLYDGDWRDDNGYADGG